MASGFRRRFVHTVLAKPYGHKTSGTKPRPLVVTRLAVREAIAIRRRRQTSAYVASSRGYFTARPAVRPLLVKGQAENRVALQRRIYGNATPIRPRVVPASTLVTVNIATRAGRLRAADAVAPIKAIAIAARGRTRAADSVAPRRSVSVATRAARIRSTVGAAPTGVTLVNIATRGARIRAGATCTASRVVAVSTRAGRLRAADAVAPLRTAALNTRGGRLRATVGAGNLAGTIHTVNIATRAGRVRAVILAGPPLPFDYLDPRSTVRHRRSHSVSNSRKA